MGHWSFTKKIRVFAMEPPVTPTKMRFSCLENVRNISGATHTSGDTSGPIKQF